MKDRYDRKIDYVRISITDRCNLRCKYCMPEDGIKLLEHSDILSYEKILKICEAFTKIGITTFKITGGEPLVRKGVIEFIKALKALDNVKEVTLTTNGVLIDRMAESLIESKVDRINVSLDTLDRDRFFEITRRDSLDIVLKGIYRMVDLGFKNLKINSVPIKPLISKDLLGLANLAKDMPISVRFIELMPIGKGNEYIGSTREDILRILEANFGRALAYEGKLGNGPAKYIKFKDFIGYIGFIEALNDKFCDDCNRIRLSATGFLKLCLHYDYGFDIKDLVDDLGVDDLAIKLENIIYKKPKSHNFGERKNHADNKNMNQIGG